MIVLFVGAIGLSGYFITAKGDCESRKEFKNSPVDSARAEIDAAVKLGTEEGKVRVLKTIAERPDLSPQARLHLVEVIGLLGNDEDREYLLVTLAENPSPASPPQVCK